MGVGSAAECRPDRHPDEHRTDQNRVESAARGRFQTVDDALVGDQRGLYAQVKQQGARDEQPEIFRHGG
ncbi:hypothetical protein SDC9_196210 [bioreactor metagenome]|uniref:Uncharacterized protein n=1 Tax=bioreactor metagenome TaxID=1076179 RepID=A0A645IBT3_9ZZZZ